MSEPTRSPTSTHAQYAFLGLWQPPQWYSLIRRRRQSSRLRSPERRVSSRPRNWFSCQRCSRSVGRAAPAPAPHRWRPRPHTRSGRQPDRTVARHQFPPSGGPTCPILRTAAWSHDEAERYRRPAYLQSSSASSQTRSTAEHATTPEHPCPGVVARTGPQAVNPSPVSGGSMASGGYACGRASPPPTSPRNASNAAGVTSQAATDPRWASRQQAAPGRLHPRGRTRTGLEAETTTQSMGPMANKEVRG
jgi:hypothetical protein